MNAHLGKEVSALNFYFQLFLTYLPQAKHCHDVICCMLRVCESSRTQLLAAGRFTQGLFLRTCALISNVLAPLLLYCWSKRNHSYQCVQDLTMHVKTVKSFCQRFGACSLEVLCLSFMWFSFQNHSFWVVTLAMCRFKQVVMNNNLITGGGGAPCSKVELSVSCTNLKDADLFSKSDPMCVLFVKVRCEEWLLCYLGKIFPG